MKLNKIIICLLTLFIVSYCNIVSARYIQSDPIGLEGGVNTYGYVGANPVNLIDPLGLSPEEFYEKCKKSCAAEGETVKSFVTYPFLVTNVYKCECTKKVCNKIPNGKEANHIFSDKPNKLADTAENRKLLTDLTNDTNNYLGRDSYGKDWFSKILENGEEIYGYTQDGTIKGGGINPTPRDITTAKGLMK